MGSYRSPCWSARYAAVDETVILLRPPLPLVGVSIVMERERQHNDSLSSMVNGMARERAPTTACARSQPLTPAANQFPVCFAGSLRPEGASSRCRASGGKTRRSAVCHRTAASTQPGDHHCHHTILCDRHRDCLCGLLTKGGRWLGGWDSSKLDSTRARVGWAGAGELSAVAGAVVKLQWRLSGASLYSFWVSETACGESNGYLGGGGPGSVKGRDARGSCT